VGAEEDIGCARGFETRERDQARSFRWADGAALVRLHAPGYGAPLLLEIALAAPRTPGAPPTATTLNAGSLQVEFDVAAPRRYRMLVPPSPLAGDLLTVALTSETWRPANDRRTLGVQVSDVRLRPTGGLRIAGPFHVAALLALGLATACFGLRAGYQRAAFPLGLALMLLAGALWALLPARVAPFLPGLALILGTAALFPIKQSLPQPAPGDTGTVGPLRLNGVGVLLLAIGIGAAVEAAFAAGLLHGPWSMAGVLLQGAVTLWAVWHTRALRLSLAALLAVALAVRLLALGSRLLTGGAGSDADVELFYSYGRATLELGLPVVEYPSGALLPWALMALPGSRELFALLLPLLNTLCDLAIVWGLYRISALAHVPANIVGHSHEAIGSQPSAAQRAPGLQRSAFSVQRSAFSVQRSAFSVQRSAFSLFYALSPLLLPFWYGKFDSLPAALLVVGLVAFLARRPAPAGALLGLGGTVKWVPWLAAPALALHELHAGFYHEDTKTRRLTTSWSSRLRVFVVHPAPFVAAFLAAVAAASLPFALRDGAAFLAPYTMQGGRPLIGESIWFLPAVVLEPRLLGELPSPWSNVEEAPIGPMLTVAAQGLALVALLVPVLLRPPDRRRTLALAALAPAVFLLLNRVFSPQYVLIITACALAAGAAVLREREALLLIVLLAVAQTANLLVWPHTARGWLAASAVLFATAIGAAAWLAVRAARLEPVQPGTAAQRVSPAPHQEELVT
jgi:hypothetical protein